ncbi:MAG: hypothetical protein PF487_14190 [Bacteroidales bacterium]|jgi:hypothetical protein|nr:hypothetical protein [Bacteroidales bacterium]
MIKSILNISLIFLIIVLLSSCEQKHEVEELVIPENITPGSVDDISDLKTDDSIDVSIDSSYFSAQILIDREYSIFDLQNINIDSDEEDEQIILASPVSGGKKRFKIYVADYNDKMDEYIEIYHDEISDNNLNVASIESEDITGDHFNEIIITGIDTKGLQIFEIYKLVKNIETNEKIFVKVFSQSADGDFEINKVFRGNDYKIDNLDGESFTLELQ